MADDRESTLDRLVSEDDKELLMNAIKKLSDKEQQVLALYYYEGLSLKEIGRVIGVTESRVSQIHGKALSLLRAVLKEEA